MTTQDAGPTIQTLLVGNGINFQQGDLALSGVFLVRSTDRSGNEVRTIIDSGHVGMRRNILEALAKLGLTVEDIDQVALTHLHWDHVQNVDLFPNAEIVLSAAELDSVKGATARDLVTPAWTRYLLADARVRVVQPGDELSQGVEVLDASGHTAGSIAFALEMGGETQVVTGDALPWAEVGRLQQSALVFWNLEESQATIGRLVSRADIIYPGHDRPFRLRDGQVEYQMPYEMTLFGASPDTPGLAFGTPPILKTIDLTDGLPVGPRWTREELEQP
jgi:glyoxylase-like metal-dependent hydrolase (beta-lactamase superfamily II)